MDDAGRSVDLASTPEAFAIHSSPFSDHRRLYQLRELELPIVEIVRHARVINNNLADYLIPTNSDIPDLKVMSVGVPDHHASILGGKAVGELAIVGVAAAIANVVFHSTVRDLPITLEKLL